MSNIDIEIETAGRLLPAWFVPRMMGDVWWFGLLLTTGHVLSVAHISSVHQAADGSIWLDVEMEDGVNTGPGTDGLKLIRSPTSRTSASVNAAHVVAAFELADT